MRLLFPGAGTLGYAVWPGVGIACAQSIPPDSYPPRVNVGQFILLPPLHATPYPLCPDSLALPLLPVWMNVASLNPWLLDFHTVRFSGSSECFLFGLVVILLMVV